MSKQHKGRYTDDEIEELRTRLPLEQVDALVADANAVADAEEEDLLGDAGDDEGEDGKVDYTKLNKPELTQLLKDRGLDESGTNAEQAERLKADDEAKAE